MSDLSELAVNETILKLKGYLPLAKRIDDAEEEVTQARAKVTQLQEQIIAADNLLRTHPAAKLEAKVQTLQARVADLGADIAEKQQLLASLNQQVDVKRTEHEQIEASLGSLRKQILGG